MEGKVSEGSKAMNLMLKLWSTSVWKDKICKLITETTVDDSFLCMNHNDRVSHISQCLNELSIADRLALTCLADIIPMRIESKIILNYLIQRLKPDWKDAQVELLKKQNECLAMVINGIDSSKLVYQWEETKKAKELKEEFEAKIAEITKRNNAEIKFKWIAKYAQAREERNNYKSMLSRCLHTIYENRYTKATLNRIYDLTAETTETFSVLAQKLFAFSGPRIKKWTNMTKNKLKKLMNFITDKLKGFLLQEELNNIQKYHLEEQGILWSNIAREEMKKIPKAEKIYQSLSLEQQYDAMKMLCKGTQEVDSIHEIRLQIKSNINSSIKMLTNSTSSETSSLNLNLSAIKAQEDDEEWEEMEEEEEINTTDHEKTQYLKKIFKNK